MTNEGGELGGLDGCAGSQGGEDVEEFREGFCAAGGVINREPRRAVAVQIVAAENAETHGETVVVVGLDQDA